MHRIRFALLALVLAAGSARAGIESAGTTAANFLSVGTGASVLAMGGAALAVGDDISAAAWNPAALARLGSTQFALSHAALAQTSAQDLASAGGRLGHGSTRWGASMLYQGDGSFDGRDALGVPTGSFSAASMAVGVQVARPIGSVLTAGMGARWLSDNLGDATGTGMAFDLGLQSHLGPLGLGVAARNIGGSMKYPSGRFELPAVYGVGASLSDVSRGLRMAVDANFPSAYYNDVRVGGEWRWQDRVALRAGYRMELGAAIGEPLAGPSFGLGAGANGLWMDYAFLAGNSDAQGQHRLALTFHPAMTGGRAHPVADASAGEPRVYEVVVETQTSADSVMGADGTIRPLTPMEQLALDVADRLPPGAIESESSPRELIPLHVLAVSPLARLEPLVIMKPTGSITDTEDDKPEPAKPAPAKPPLVAVRSGLVPPVGKPPSATRVTVVRPGPARPATPVPVAARATVIRPVSSSNPSAPVVVTRPAAPTVVNAPPAVNAPVAAARPVAGPPVPAARVATSLPAPSAPVAAARVVAAPAVVSAPIVTAPVAAAPPVAAARPVPPPAAEAVAVPAPRPAAPVAAAPPAVATPVVATPAVATPAVATPVVATPVVSAPVAAVPPAVPASSDPAPVVIAPSDFPELSVNHPVRPARAPRTEPATRPEAVSAPASPEVTPAPPAREPAATPVNAPESVAPEAAPAAPAPPPATAPTPTPAKPAKTSAWPRVSAAMPTVHYAGVTQTIAVVSVPPEAPATEPITKPAGPRPKSVQVKGDETLADIAKRWDTSVPALMMENNLVSTTVKGGQKLVLPAPLH